MGTDQKGKPVWLSVTGFNPRGLMNFRVNAVQDIKDGFARYKEIWVSKDDIILRHFEEGQLSMDLYSREEFEAKKKDPRIHNRRRFEITTKNERQYIYAPDVESARQIAKQQNLGDFTIKQVRRLTGKEIDRQ